MTVPPPLFPSPAHQIEQALAAPEIPGVHGVDGGGTQFLLDFGEVSPRQLQAKNLAAAPFQFLSAACSRSCNWRRR